MHSHRGLRRGIVLVVVLALLANAFVGVAAAETRGGGTVVVGSGETVDGLTAFGGTVIVRGTVDGDLSGLAGSVVVEPSGVVTGDVSVSAGSVRIDGRVDGNVNAAAGSVTLGSGGEVGGNFRAGSGSVRLNGSVGGDAVLGANTVTLGPDASVGGDLRYDDDATFTNDGGTVGGSIVAESNLTVGGFAPLRFPGWIFTGYAMVVNLVVGAVLLAVMPGFSRRVVETVATKPLQSGGVGLGALIGVPIALVLIALTIIGIPLMLVGVLLFVLLSWIALLYGRIAVADWALKQADVDNRWLALFVGIVGFGLLGQIPILGGLLTLATFLLGLGAIVLALLAIRRGTGDEDSETGVEATERSSEDVAGA